MGDIEAKYSLTHSMWRVRSAQDACGGNFDATGYTTTCRRPAFSRQMISDRGLKHSTFRFSPGFQLKCILN